jgi:type III restriction enzyme
MKLHFEPDLDYQLDAVEAACGLFRGQEICRTEFTVTRYATGSQRVLEEASRALGIGNRLTLLDDQVLKNLTDVQLQHGLTPSEGLASGDFTVEMETGTGKTYVYLRTIFELNKRYGFTKFVIVVPSVAIKEGVYKSLQITEEHFRGLYAGVPFDYFLYDSGKLGQVRNFATSSTIQIMVMTVQSIVRRDYAVVYQESEKLGGQRPIDLIRETRPILIVDEPQSVDGGLEGKGKAALGEMNPLCTLRYSATHVDKHHMIYKLDAVDAYEKGLVKQIEVAAATVEDAHNKPYVKLVKVERKKGALFARVELDVQTVTGSVVRKEVLVQDGDKLDQTTGRAVYADCRVGEIRAGRGKEYVELRVPGGEQYLSVGQAWADVDPSALQREMIRRTIREHLDKEKRLRPQGIKVLSLFFIDTVAKYRSYDDAGNAVKGEWARMFEEEYRRAAKLPDYRTLFDDVDLKTAAEEVHDGYFSIDKKGSWTDTSENNQGNRDNAERAYNLIMKDKERLLSFDTPLKFIFSHSALREGWDNPNVFQICTLRDIRTERERRQTIGRGLRLCVNQDGQRLRGSEINTLTVVAMEGYKEFAENLQKEIETDTGIQFGIVIPTQFAAIPVTAADGARQALGVDQSKALWEHLRAAGLIDDKGKVQDALRTALKNGTLGLPPALEAQRGPVTDILKKLSAGLKIHDANDRRPIKPRQAVLHSPEFKALWDRIKHKTTYRVEFDNADLIAQCTKALHEMPPIPRTRLQWRKADVAIGKGGVVATEKRGAEAPVNLEEGDIELPDLLTELQDRTQLTRRSLHKVVTDSGRLDDFKKNPQLFIQQAAEAINRRKRLAIVDGVKYQRLGDEHYYAQELFEQEELTGYLKNLLPAEKSVYESVVYDSSIESSFAEQLENNTAIKLYAKLPGWFVVPTPLGGYNPDWAVLVEKDGEERLYFVVETKSGLFADGLREIEKGKIVCGRAHFAALQVCENAARYVVAQRLGDVFSADPSPV